MSGFSYVVWLVIGILCGIVEVFTLGFWFLWLALGALLVSLGVKLGLLSGLGAQILVFAVITVFFIVFTRPLVMKFFKTKEVRSNVDSLVGAIGLVTQEITPFQTGQVKLNGEVWTASANQEIPENSRVVVRAIEGVKILVEPVQD
ncbi:MAG: NfeD family protein [Chitinophagales bacterium]